MLFTLIPDLNFAALKYKYVLREHGGPIASVSFRERLSPEGPFFEAFAFLDEKITSYQQAGNSFHGGAHGFGLGLSKPEAVHAAISSALELWAWHASSKDAELRQSLGFPVDPSRAGFAAFPGLGQQGAKKRALFEAARLWALRAWWEGKLPHSPLAVRGFEGILLVPPIPGLCVALLWWVSEGLVCYGSGASYNGVAAAAAARADLQKNRDILELLVTSRSMIGSESSSVAEKRMLFFADPAGFALFQERLARKGAASPAPTLLVDLPVRGPWSQYAHVWRCLFDCKAFHETDKESYFLF